MDKHIGQSNAYLQARVASRSGKLNFNAAARGAILTERGGVNSRNVMRAASGMSKTKAGKLKRAVDSLRAYKSSPKVMSTFKDAKTADHWYAQALRENRSRIAAWRQAPGKHALSIPFSSKTPIGTQYTGRSGKFRPATKGAFTLMKSGSTIYPHRVTLS